MKLNVMASSFPIKAYGFEAFKAYAEAFSQKEGPVQIVSTLSPAIMHSMGIDNYYSPDLPRDAVYTTAKEVYDADLQVNSVTVYKAPDVSLFGAKLIVSRHEGTAAMLKEMHPDAEVFTGDATPELLERYYVIGALPPTLIQYCKVYVAAAIEGFDYAKDKDLYGEELKSRLIIGEPITCEVKPVKGIQRAVGLVRGRHTLPVDEYIFDEIQDVLDFETMEKHVEQWLNAYPCDALALYVTGLTSAVATVIKVCYAKDIGLTLMHYDASSGEYVPQKIR